MSLLLSFKLPDGWELHYPIDESSEMPMTPARLVFPAKVSRRHSEVRAAPEGDTGGMVIGVDFGSCLTVGAVREQLQGKKPALHLSVHTAALEGGDAGSFCRLRV